MNGWHFTIKRQWMTFLLTLEVFMFLAWRTSLQNGTIKTKYVGRTSATPFCIVRKMLVRSCDAVAMRKAWLSVIVIVSVINQGSGNASPSKVDFDTNTFLCLTNTFPSLKKYMIVIVCVINHRSGNMFPSKVGTLLCLSRKRNHQCHWQWLWQCLNKALMHIECTLNNSPAGDSAKHYLFHIMLFQILKSTFATSFFHDCQLFCPIFRRNTMNIEERANKDLTIVKILIENK